MRTYGSVRFQVLCCLVVSLPGIFALAQSAPAADKAATPPAAAHPVMIELFTSEGCSSCPPADIILQRLDEFQPIEGAQLIVLSEHVTYWDHDGWKDPNSSQPLTDRQSSYESALHLPSSYTPQLIVDGTAEIRVDKTQQMEQILERAKLAPKVSVRISDVSIDPGSPAVLKARIEAAANSGKQNADVFVALVLDHVESQVLKGENGGHHLTHVAVVRKLVKVGKLPKGKEFGGDFQVKLSPEEDPKNLRLIAFAQVSGPGMIVGAAEWKAAKTAGGK